MTDRAQNRVEPEPSTAPGHRGDVPERVRRRYLTDDRGGPGLSFYLDATTTRPAFRDQGHQLSTDRSDPNVIRDLVAIAAHRGWRTISVGGQTDFRRETWLAARSAGLTVKGYRPTERDEQALARRRRRGRAAPTPQAPPGHDLDAPGPSRRMKVVETVVRARIVEPATQAKILAAARSRIATWLERGANFEPPPEPHLARQRRERGR